MPSARAYFIVSVFGKYLVQGKNMISSRFVFSVSRLKRRYNIIFLEKFGKPLAHYSFVNFHKSVQ